MTKRYIGLDIGGTKCAVSLAQVDDAAAVRIMDKHQFPTAGHTPQAALETLLAETDAILNDAGLRYGDIEAAGISCGGPLDSVRGVILSPPNLPGWDEIEAVSFFERRTGIRTALQNDANACALAEWRFGAGKGTRNMIFLTFGTGLGAGLILNGQLYSGASDMAGEIGHVRLEDDGPVGYGKHGSTEGFCSGGGIAQLGVRAVRKALAEGETPQLLLKAGSEQAITAKLIAELAHAGDPLCVEIYRDCGRHLGATLSILIDILNPEKIVLGGIFMRSADLLAEEMRRVIEAETLIHARKVCEIVPAGLGESVGDYAAIAVAAGSAAH